MFNKTSVVLPYLIKVGMIVRCFTVQIIWCNCKRFDESEVWTSLDQEFSSNHISLHSVQTFWVAICNVEFCVVFNFIYFLSHSYKNFSSLSDWLRVHLSY